MNLFLQILFQILLTVLIIYGIHHIWNYLRDTYSTKKTRDLVNSQISKYKRLIEDIQSNQPSSVSLFENQEEKDAMRNELAEFMNEQSR
jgi:predicted PurR-regulated permease PerM